MKCILVPISLSLCSLSACPQVTLGGLEKWASLWQGKGQGVVEMLLDDSLEAREFFLQTSIMSLLRFINMKHEWLWVVSCVAVDKIAWNEWWHWSGDIVKCDWALGWCAWHSEFRCYRLIKLPPIHEVWSWSFGRQMSFGNEGMDRLPDRVASRGASTKDLIAL